MKIEPVQIIKFKIITIKNFIKLFAQKLKITNDLEIIEKYPIVESQPRTSVTVWDQHLLILGFYAFKKLNQASIQLCSTSCENEDGARVFFTI